MTQEQMLAGLKKDVRSLLVSAKLGLAPEQLKRDYANMLGHPLPLRQLGFRNVMDMVSEMPDVVSIGYQADGSLVLKAVSDESTRGIEELVARQRKTKSNIKTATRRGGVGFFSPRYSQHFYHPSQVVLPRRGSAPPAIPFQLRAQLRQLLSQGPIRLSELESNFIHCFGHPLRVTNYGFYSIVEMLAAASDLITVKPGRMGSVLSLKEPSTGMPVLKPRPVRTGLIKSGSPTPFSSVPMSAKARPATNHAAPVDPNPPSPASTQNDFAPLKESALSSNRSESIQESQQMEPTTPKLEPTEERQHFQKLVIKLEAELRQRILENGDGGSVSPELKDKLRQVVGQRREGLSVHDLPAEYKRLFGEELPLAQSGFLSVTEMVGALTDIFYLKPVVGDEGHHRIVIDIHDTTNAQTGEHQSDGVCGDEDVNLTGKSYYFSCGDSPWDGHGEEDDSSLDKQDQEMEDQITTKTLQQMPEMYPTVQVRFESVVPLDALRGQRLKPPTRRANRELVAVLVEQVESPSHFYIRFSESKEARAMEDMMIEMRSCYSCPEVSERYHLPQRYVRQGQVCCVAPREMWFYRVVIHRIISPTQAEVYYVDFGDLTVVERANLKFLKSCYSELPAQAVPSSLVGIVPMGGSWSASAAASFQNLCCERTLVAALQSYHGDVLQLFLCDTHTEEDVYIHAALQAQGHGLTCSSAASTALFGQFNPVSQYLGEGVFDEGMEVEEEVVPCTNTPLTPEHCQQTSSRNRSPSAKEEEALPELPGLEFIEVSKVTAQGQRANPFKALLHKDPPVICSDWDKGWSLAPPQAPQATKEPTHPVQIPTPPHPPPSTTANTSIRASPEEKPTWPGYTRVGMSPASPMVMPLTPPPPTLRTLSLHTPGLLQTQGCFYGVPLPPLQPHTPGFMFPLFGTGEGINPDRTCVQQTSPFHPAPAVHLASGPLYLNWYPSCTT